MALTQIAGSVSLALGLGPAVGQMKIANPAFVDTDGNYHPASASVIALGSGGAFSLELAPTTNSTPPNVLYTVTYYLGPGQLPFSEYWSVPEVAVGITLDIPQVRQQPVFPARPLSIPVEQLFSATGNIGDVLVNTGGGYAPVTLQSIYPFTFSNQSQIAIPQTDHGQGTALIIQIYGQDGSQLDGAVNVNPALGDVAVTFSGNESGFGFIYGGLGRGLPNFAQTVINEQTLIVAQSTHRFNTPNLVIQVFDQYGDLVTDEAAISIDPSFNVTVNLETPRNFKAVICGCLGVTQAASQGSSGGGASGPDIPFLVAVAEQMSVQVTAVTHGKGFYPRVDAATNDVPPRIFPVNYTVDGAGNIAAYFDPAFTGTIRVF